MTYACAQGPVLVEIRNPVYGSSRAETTTAVLAALARPVCARSLAFTSAPDQAPVPAIRIILCFHPARGLNPTALAGGALRTSAPGARLSLLAVFASGAEVLASVEGRIGGVTSPQHPGFAALVHQAMRALLA